MMKQLLIKSWSLLNRPFAVIIAIVLQFPYCFWGQNLVPNYSFEDTIKCPFGDGELYLASPWYSPSMGTPDLYNSCDTVGVDGVPINAAGSEPAKNGDGYCGIYTFSPPVPEGREYIQVALSDTLITGNKYYVEFYVSLADLSKYAANDIGAYFSVSAVGSSDYYILPYVPQIANSNNSLTSDSGWYKISGSFISTGGEKYITIGNFKNDASTDTLTVNPGSTWDAAYYYIDDVLVIEDTSNSINEFSGFSAFSIYPNPNDGNMQLDYKLKEGETGELKIFDVAGKLVELRKLNPENNTLKINGSEFLNGVYFYQLSVNGEIKTIDKIVIIK